MNIDLNGKRILVTGASRGIGRAVAEQLIASGARVAVHYNQRRDTADAIAAQGDGCYALHADLADPAAAAELGADAIAALGGLDGIVNNAAIALASPVDREISEWVSDWNRTLSTNLVSAAVLSRIAIEDFRKHGGGRIVFVASRAAFRGDAPEYQAYAASKGGMVSLSRSIARGFGQDGIVSFVVAPGFTRTDMAQPFIDDYGEAMAMKDIALDRMTEPGDVAPLVVFLVSGMADHATGSTIDVNAASYVR